MQRRHFLQASLAALIAPSLRTAENRPPRIVLRSSWQTVNIGDIAHTPGVLRLLEEHLPEAEIWLWPSNVDNGVRELLLARFPKLRILRGDAEIREAFEQGDFLLHGSGPSLVAERDVRRWHEETGKPFGVYGITLPYYPPGAGDVAGSSTIELLSHARFAFFRDGVSLARAKELGCTCPVIEFGPDGAFATDLRNDEAAESFLAAHGLEPGQFLCCIPRLRHTPYWLVKNVPFNPERHARNEEMKEHDHRPLREAIARVVRETDLKVLVCPEDQTQMAVGKENIVDKLPDDVRQRIVWRENYWLTDEALSTYVRSAGLFGNEMHSPIMCIGAGVPAIVCRFAEQTSKGTMWRDIGLGDWLFDLDIEVEVERVPAAVLSMAQDPAAAKAKAAEGRAVVEARQRATMGILRESLAVRQA